MSAVGHLLLYNFQNWKATVGFVMMIRMALQVDQQQI
jgi:hypothetical protein